jgi:hypothetical protein
MGRSTCRDPLSSASGRLFVWPKHWKTRNSRWLTCAAGPRRDKHTIPAELRPHHQAPAATSGAMTKVSVVSVQTQSTARFTVSKSERIWCADDRNLPSVRVPPAGAGP